MPSFPTNNKAKFICLIAVIPKAVKEKTYWVLEFPITSISYTKSMGALGIEIPERAIA